MKMSNTSSYSEDELNQLKTSIKHRISAHVGVPITPTSFTQVEKKFNGDSLIVDNYPVREIHSIKIGNEKLNNKDYTLDKDAGLIYFKRHYHGFLVLKYICCISDEQMLMYINPLVDEILEYDLDVGWTKNASSIKEGDVQINLDTSIGKGALIQKKLDDLKSMFNMYMRMI